MLSIKVNLCGDVGCGLGWEVGGVRQEGRWGVGRKEGRWGVGRKEEGVE